jgi:hypothetical protein
LQGLPFRLKSEVLQSEWIIKTLKLRAIHALNDVLHAAERERLGVPLFKLAKDHWYPANIIDHSLQRAGNRWHPVSIRARSGHDHYRGRGTGAQFDVVWKLVDAHRYR